MVNSFEFFFTRETTLSTITQDNYSGSTIWTTSPRSTTFEPFPEEDETKWQIFVIVILVASIATIALGVYSKVRACSNKENSSHPTPSPNNDQFEVALLAYRHLESPQEESQLYTIYNPLNTDTTQEPPDYDTILEMDLPSYEEITSTC